MKKKIFIAGLLVCIICSCVACGKTNLEYVLQNMSERTNYFYFGENEEFYATLAIGAREEEYIMNGKSGDVVDFSLLSIVFDDDISKNAISVSVDIDGEKFDCEAECNPMSGAFMVDLEKQMSGNENVSISYDGVSLVLNNLSNEFGVDSSNAIEIGCGELSEKIDNSKNYAVLDAECYLKILDKKANNFDEFFWCFSILTVSGENYSVIISTVDGSVLAKSN